MSDKLLFCERINELLMEDASLYAALGTDSTPGERRTVRAQSRRIYEEIKQHNKELGEDLLSTLK